MPSIFLDAFGVDVVNTSLQLPLESHLGLLGIPGLMAYTGLHELGKPKKGETIFVSAALGGVGVAACQFAQVEGVTVIGCAGTDDKVDFLKKELGVSAFNYKKEDAVEALARLAPQGIDMYFDVRFSVIPVAES